MLAVIPARGGSKRLPAKNIKAFASAPLIAHTIAQAQACPEIERLIVSTDDAGIQRTAARFGAEVLLRPPQLATDTATTAVAIQHVVQQLYDSENYLPEGVLTLQATNPLRQKGMLSQAIAAFREYPEASSLMGVSENDRKLGQIEAGYFEASLYQTGQRSQDLKPFYYENGLVYISQSQKLLEEGDLFGDKIVPFLLPNWCSLGDIDTAADFEVAEALFQAFRNRLDGQA